MRVSPDFVEGPFATCVIESGFVVARLETDENGELSLLVDAVEKGFSEWCFVVRVEEVGELHPLYVCLAPVEKFPGSLANKDDIRST